MPTEPQARILEVAEELERLDAEMTPKPWDPFFQDVENEYDDFQERWVQMGPTDQRTKRRADSTLLERDADVIGIAYLRNHARKLAKVLRRTLALHQDHTPPLGVEHPFGASLCIHPSGYQGYRCCLEDMAAALEDEP